MKKDQIKVLVVDDSAVVRNALTEILNSDPLIAVTDTAADPYVAVKKIAQQLPDVITLDMEMPRMNGLTFLKKLMAQHPIPVVVISSIVGDRSDIAIRALELGAANIITKPKLGSAINLEEYKISICDAVKSAAISDLSIKKKSKKRKNEDIHVIAPETSVRRSLAQTSTKMIAIGASTGGTEVISTILKSLKNDLPPVLIVQHMPGEFTTAFAKRLDQECALSVNEAKEGDILRDGHVYVANGFHHLVVKKLANQYVCKIEDGELVNRHRPSIDVLFKSVAKVAPHNSMGILLSGMGADGAQGLLELMNNGAVCIAQDEVSSVVYGMAKEAIKLGAANFVGNPSEIINWINDFS